MQFYAIVPHELARHPRAADENDFVPCDNYCSAIIFGRVVSEIVVALSSECTIHERQ